MMTVITMPQRCAEALKQMHDDFVLHADPSAFSADYQRDIAEGIKQFAKGVEAGRDMRGKKRLVDGVCGCEPCEGEHE